MTRQGVSLRWPAAATLLAGSALIPAALPSTARAQDIPAEDTAVVLDTIVVTAAGFQQNVAEAPATISVVPGEQLRQEMVRDLGDALRAVPGVVTAGNANEGEISIRGLPGTYTLILLDGVRQGTRDSRPNGSGGIEQNFMPPPEAIDRIEVLRGPASTLYGSDAVGGVINIITKKVSDVPTAGFSLGYTRQQHGDYGNTVQGTAYVSGPIIAERLGYQIWGQAQGRDEDSLLGGTQGRENYEVGGRLTFAPNAENTFRLDAGVTRLRNESTPGQTLAETDLLDGVRYNDRSYVRLSQQGDYAWGTTHLSLQRETGERTIYAGGVENLRSPEIVNYVLDGNTTVPLGAHRVTFGLQYIHNELTDQNPGLRDGVDRSFTSWQYSLFTEDEWQVTDRFALTAGLRMDHHEQYGSHFAPRLYGVYDVNEQVTLKGGVSTGYRTPDIRSISPGYAYTTGGGGCFYGPADELPAGINPCAVMVGNPDLKPETSVNYEAGILYDNLSNLTAGATVFYTELKDQVNSERVYNADGSFARWEEDPNYTLFRFYNLDEARIQGLELAATWAPVDGIDVLASYTYTDSEQKTGTYAGLPLSRTPKHAGTIRVNWTTPVEGLDAYAAGNYIGSQINAGARIGLNGAPVTRDGAIIARKYDGYFTADLGASYRISDTWTLNGAVYNLLDERKGPEDIDNVVTGRNFWLSLSATF